MSHPSDEGVNTTDTNYKTSSLNSNAMMNVNRENGSQETPVTSEVATQTKTATDPID